MTIFSKSFRSNELSVKWIFGQTTFCAIFFRSNGIFCRRLIRSNDHFLKKNRSYDLSVKWTLGQTVFGQMVFRSNGLSVKWCFGQMAFGQKNSVKWLFGKVIQNREICLAKLKFQPFLVEIFIRDTLRMTNFKILRIFSGSWTPK
jgi:hypothetical protein